MIEIIDTFISEDGLLCEHCGRSIKNIVTIKDGETIKKVGTGCIKKMVGEPIEQFFNDFSFFAKIQKKINKKIITGFSVSDDYIDLLSGDKSVGWCRNKEFFLKSLKKSIAKEY